MDIFGELVFCLPYHVQSFVGDMLCRDWRSEEIELVFKNKQTKRSTEMSHTLQGVRREWIYAKDGRRSKLVMSSIGPPEIIKYLEWEYWNWWLKAIGSEGHVIGHLNIGIQNCRVLGVWDLRDPNKGVNRFLLKYMNYPALVSKVILRFQGSHLSRE